MADRPSFTIEPMDQIPARPAVALPSEIDPRRLARRALLVVGAIAAVVAAVLLAPGLGEVRDRLRDADMSWLALAVVLEVLSSLSYLLMFRPVFCSRMSRRSAAELALSELAVGSLVPAAGAGGLALGVWALRRGGMPGDEIATRTVAFFLIKSAANFVAVAVIGLVMAAGLFGPPLGLELTLLPALLAIAVMAAVLGVPRLARRPDVDEHAPRRRRLPARAARATTDGVQEAVRILRSRDTRVIAGSLGYWLFDNAMLWACFHAFGSSPSFAIVLMAYLLGQLGGLLPLPGGLGGIDGGLLGALVVFGVPAAAAAAAVLAYRVVLFWVPLVIGGVAFASLQRGLNRPDRPDLCPAPT